MRTLPVIAAIRVRPSAIVRFPNVKIIGALDVGCGLALRSACIHWPTTTATALFDDDSVSAILLASMVRYSRSPWYRSKICFVCGTPAEPDTPPLPGFVPSILILNSHKLSGYQFYSLHGHILAQDPSYRISAYLNELPSQVLSFSAFPHAFLDQSTDFGHPYKRTRVSGQIFTPVQFNPTDIVQESVLVFCPISRITQIKIGQQLVDLLICIHVSSLQNLSRIKPTREIHKRA